MLTPPTVAPAPFHSRLAAPCLLVAVALDSFAEQSLAMTGQRGIDRVRNYPIGRMTFKLNYFEEVRVGVQGSCV